MDENFVTKKMLKGQENGFSQLDSTKLNVKGNEQHAMLQRSYDAYRKDYDELMASKRWKKEDSDTMQDVKSAFGMIDIFLNEEVVKSKKIFERHLTQLKNMYEYAIQCCDAYLAVHEGDRSIFGKGRYRKSLVEKMRLRAENDKDKLVKRANELWEETQNDNEKRPLWVNVLADVRTSRINLDEAGGYKIQSVGQRSSTVLKIEDKKKPKTFFVKKAEHNWNMDDEYKDIIQNENYTKKQRAIMKWLKDFFEGTGGRGKGLRKYIIIGCEGHVKAIDRSVFAPDLLVQKKVIYEQMLMNIIIDCKKNQIKLPFELNGDKLPKELNDNHEVIVRFLRHMYLHYNNMNNCKTSKIECGANLSLRNVATSRMADLLGLGKLVAKSDRVKYQYHGQKDREGILMEEASGETFKSITDKAGQTKIYADTKTMLELNSIGLFDFICGQTDRNTGNLMCKYEPKKFNTVKGNKEVERFVISAPKCIDNDLSFGKLKYKDLASGVVFNSYRFEDKDGMCKYALLDSQVVTKMETLMEHPEVIRFEMADLLSEEEIGCLIDRMKGALKTINRTREWRGEILVDPNKFTFEDEHKEALSNQFDSIGQGQIVCI